MNACSQSAACSDFTQSGCRRIGARATGKTSGRVVALAVGGLLAAACLFTSPAAAQGWADYGEGSFDTAVAADEAFSASESFSAAGDGAVVVGEPTPHGDWLPGEQPVFPETYGEYPGACQHCGPLGPCRCPKWIGQVDALFLWMGNIPSRTLFIDQATREPVFDANQAQTEVAVAPRYAILYQPDRCRALEINYFQVQSFFGDATLPTSAGQYEIFEIAGIPPFEPINSATVQTSAQIKSFEGNLRMSQGGPLRWLAGFRWVQWNQTMRIDDTFTDTFGNPGTDSVLVNTGNNLYGAQLGCDAMLWNRDEGFQVNGLAKAGVFGNAQAFQRTSVTSTTPGVTGELASVADQTAFFGEVGVNASMAITNWLWWRAGYTLFWISGVATPADQLGLTDIGSSTSSIDTEGSVLLHGVTTGLEARW